MLSLVVFEAPQVLDLGLPLLEGPVLGPTMGRVEQGIIKRGQFTGAEVALALQVMGAFAQHLTSSGVVLQHVLHAVLLDRTHFHPDPYHAKYLESRPTGHCDPKYGGHWSHQST